MKEKEENKLVTLLEKYNKSTEEATDAIYEFIDNKRYKTDLCEIMSKHKRLLKKLENLLRII